MSVLDIVDNVLEIDEDEFREAQLSNRTTSNILEAFEMLVEEVRKKNLFRKYAVFAEYMSLESAFNLSSTHALKFKTVFQQI